MLFFAFTREIQRQEHMHAEQNPFEHASVNVQALRLLIPCFELSIDRQSISHLLLLLLLVAVFC